jgi:hypothetical protein
VARNAQTGSAAVAQASTAGTQSAAAALVPDTAGITDAFASAAPTAKSDDSQVFHGLFADPNRAAPLAPVVSALWGVPDAGSGSTGQSGTPRKPVANAMLDLFKDVPVKGT